ncbi:MAG TPA: hypothetical protein VK961_23655 [Chthoniobacter sp.]|nr:hypothetical protein [Chthoniobacter sp.]
MNEKLRICLILFILAIASSVNGRAETADSLYNPKTAQKLDVTQISQFGPQAGKFRYDARMVHAAEIAAARAKKHSTSRCWHYVKDALVAANITPSRPVTAYAKQAGGELTQSFGFQRIRETDPWKAPLGSVIVYGGKGAGHVELRTQQGFVSDFVSAKPSPRPLIGIYIKPRA